jgi:hypothetical protein
MVFPISAQRHGSVAFDRGAGDGFLVWALEPTPDGYQLFWAIHVVPVSVWTKPYLAVIDPFRRWLVYPALLRRIHESWTREFTSAV